MNLLNSRVNLLSGNLLPIAADNSQFSIFWRTYSAAVWLIELIHTIAVIFGIIMAPNEKGSSDGVLAISIALEGFFMLMRFYSRKKLMEDMIQKMNDMLQNADEIMKDIVQATIKAIIVAFVIYGVTGIISVVMFHTMQLIVIAFEKFIFFYVNYNLSDELNAESFSSRVLILSLIIKTMGSVIIFLRNSASMCT